MFLSRSRDKQICRLKYLETRISGREQTSVRAGHLNDLSSCWEVVYLLYSLKILIKQTNAIFSARVFTTGTGASSPQFSTQHALQLPAEISRNHC